ncbi:MAG TPA: hypothetical protein VFQ85_19225 [Mycobacteriales bacterium]|jgi:hypothetical protein|nr:hypothetical protein [Mycobacteriales bacterium]
MREIVGAASVSPALSYSDTECIVIVDGRFQPGPGSGSAAACTLQSAQAVAVEFSSGVNSAFSGTFSASGTVVPTVVQRSPQGWPLVKKARLSLIGGSVLRSSTLPGIGTIEHTYFDITFPIPIDTCHPSARYADGKAGAVRPVRVLDGAEATESSTISVYV